MQDDELIALYFSRSETAIAETKQQYGTYCYSIAYYILPHPEDAEECENDTYWKAWNAIPPTRPRHLKSFLGKITRNIALHVWEHQHAEKRGGTTMVLVLEELSECIPSEEDVEQAVENFELRTHLNRFLADLPKETRMIFVRRYWYFYTISEIAAEYGFGESKVKMVLSRTRKKLKVYLEKEGVEL